MSPALTTRQPSENPIARAKDAMLEEIKYQIKTVGSNVWITYIGERFDLLIENLSATFALQDFIYGKLMNMSGSSLEEINEKTEDFTKIQKDLNLVIYS